MDYRTLFKETMTGSESGMIWQYGVLNRFWKNTVSARRMTAFLRKTPVGF